MAACYLTYRQREGAPAPANEHMKVELIMETYSTRFQDLLGTHFTCFTGTKVPILTQKALRC